MAFSVAAACAQRSTTGFVSSHPWAASGQWLRADTHMHSRFSDGGQEIGPLVAKAKSFGCQVVAVTDHADSNLTGASPEYSAAVRAARAENPDLLILAGLEWNVPPFGGKEHLSVLVPQGPGEGPMLAEFKQRFDDYGRSDGSKPRAEEALSWLAETTRDLPVKPVVIYNHPSRKDTSSRLNVDDIVGWRNVNDVVIGFEGGPGHQGKLPIGDYTPAEPAIDRWDPVVARAGDAWDTLLQRGVDVHGAIASSDFHNDNPGDLNDFWPCQFAETWYYVPEKTTAGVLRAMRAGAFFGVHGRIATNLDLTIVADGLPRAAMVGETIQVPKGTEVTAALAVDIPETDWQQRPNHIDAAEVFVITPDKVDVRTHALAGTGVKVVGEKIVVGEGGVVVRARVRRVVADGPDLMGYTNAIRIRAR